MKKNSKILVFLVVMGLLLAWPISALFSQLEKPAEQEPLAELDKIAEEMLVLTKKGDLDAAQAKIRQLAERFPNKTLPVAIRIESLHAVTQSILAAKKSFTSSKVSDDQLLWHATQVRVAIDALSHAHQPIWRSYYASYANQMQNLLQAAVERDVSEFRAQFEENYRLYLAIKPAMGVQLPEEQMSKISAAYDVLSKEVRNDGMEWQIIRDELRELSVTMQSAFVGEDRNTLAVLMQPDSPFMLILTIAAVISMTLTYVAWKKYAGEQASTF